MMARKHASILLALVLAGCGGSPNKSSSVKQEPPPKATLSGPPTDPDSVAKYNRGVAMMGRYQYGPAEKLFREVVEASPNWMDGRIALAIAALNNEGSSKKEGETIVGAIPLLDEVLDRDPGNIRAAYIKSYLLIRDGKFSESLPLLEKVVSLDPGDAYAALKLGECYEGLDDSDKAQAQWQRAVELDPYLVTAKYRLAGMLRRQGKAEAANRLLQEFAALGQVSLKRVFDDKYRRIGPKGVLTPLQGKDVEGTNDAADNPLAAAPGLSAPGAKWRGADAGRLLSVTACDINGDGLVDVFIAGAFAEGPARNAVLLQLPTGGFRLDPDHPLAKVADVNAALWGDFDNDGLTDVYLCRKGPNQLWRQTAKNVWKDVTTQAGAAGPGGDTVDAALVDADHDGDLDVFLVRADGANELLNNNGNGTFTPIAAARKIAGSAGGSRQVLFVDLDGDRDLDIVVINNKPPHSVFLNDRTWNYTPAKDYGDFCNTELWTAVAVDVEGFGTPSLIGWGPMGLERWSREPTGAVKRERLAVAEGLPAGKHHWLASADFLGLGGAGLVVSTESSAMGMQFFRGNTVAAWKNGRLAPPAGKSFTGLGVVVADPLKGPMIVAASEGAPPGLWQWKAGPFHAITLVGDRDRINGKASNRSGIGTRLAVEHWGSWSVQTNLGASSGPGQSLQPFCFGAVGGRAADSVVVDWSNGDFQVETDVPPGKLTEIRETDRTPSSCPILFAWNGSKYEFVSDVLGVGGLGYLAKPNEYAPPRPWENFLLPDGLLQAQDGRMKLKVVEPSEEITYLDRARLAVYDMPPGWEMTVDDRMGINGPQPTGEARFFRRCVSPTRVVNDRNVDVTEALAKADGRTAPLPPVDRAFLGRLSSEHVLTMTFAEPLDAGAVAPTLVADGWVEFPYSQTTFAAWQAKADFTAPTIEAKGADGKWTVVEKEFGYPAGMPRQMSFPLKGLPKGTRELRLRTNLEVSWDRLQVVFVEDCPAARRNVVPLAAASVARTGFPQFGRREGGMPHFDYQRKNPRMPAARPLGFYTRFGDCTEIVKEADDATAIIGPAEEVHLEFDAPPPSETGWRRRCVLELNGWCKDLDLYTGRGETVEPLPTTGKPAAERDRLNDRYNTRCEGGR